MLYAVVMAGGSGTRFWPCSRRTLPKQLLPLTSSATLIQETVARVSTWIPPERLLVVTNAAQAVETARQLPQLPAENLLIEPCARNTAPCLGFAALHLLQQDPAAVMLVMPADHAIHPVEVFREAVKCALTQVEHNPETLALFGVPPTYPATGFGYIERGTHEVAPGVFPVVRFREKPERAQAEEFLQAGTFYWNCGIFVWRADRILSAIGEHRPELYAGLQRLKTRLESEAAEQALAHEFPRLESISIDHAVLEQAGNVVVIKAPFEWDDVGSWQALARLRGVDDAENTVVGRHCGIDTQGCIIHSQDDHLITTIGMQDCIIVRTPDATFVARKDDENAIRRLIELLKEKGYDQYL